MNSHQIYSMEQLEAAIRTQNDAEFDARHAFINMEKKIKKAEDALEWVKRYHEYHDVCKKIKTIKSQRKQEQYRYEHEGDFIFYEAAVRKLKEYKIKIPPPDWVTFAAQIGELESKKEDLRSEWQEENQLLKELRTARTNMEGLLTPARQQQQEEHHSHPAKRHTYGMEL